MALSVVLDTNVVLYLLSGRLADNLPVGPHFVSVITELELLSYPELTSVEEGGIRDLLDHVNVVSLTTSVKALAIEVRRNHRVRLPDAIVVATALSLGATLCTNDKDIPKIDGLEIIRPVLQQ